MCCPDPCHAEPLGSTCCQTSRFPSEYILERGILRWAAVFRGRIVPVIKVCLLLLYVLSRFDWGSTCESACQLAAAGTQHHSMHLPSESADACKRQAIASGNPSDSVEEKVRRRKLMQSLLEMPWRLAWKFDLQIPVVLARADTVAIK